MSKKASKKAAASTKKTVTRRAKKVAPRAAVSGRAKKYVYFFGNGKAEGNRHMKDTSAERALVSPRY
jgi:hypothetical protein